MRIPNGTLAFLPRGRAAGSSPKQKQTFSRSRLSRNLRRPARTSIVRSAAPGPSEAGEASMTTDAPLAGGRRRRSCPHGSRQVGPRTAALSKPHLCLGHRSDRLPVPGPAAGNAPPTAKTPLPTSVGTIVLSSRQPPGRTAAKSRRRLRRLGPRRAAVRRRNRLPGQETDGRQARRRPSCRCRPRGCGRDLQSA
jgi:hypothetical protein